MLRVFLILSLFSGAALRAGADPLLTRSLKPLAGGKVAVAAGIRAFQREVWLDRAGSPLTWNGNVLIHDTDGQGKSIKGFASEGRLIWQATEAAAFEFSLPYYNQEFSTYLSGQAFARGLDEGGTRRADASGDLFLGWRQVLLGAGLERAGFALEFTAPTGLGPFSSAHPLLATGAGGMTAALALQAEAGDALRGWMGVRVPYLFGYSADIAPATLIAFQGDSNVPESLAGGRAWVGQAFSTAASAGFAARWYKDEGASHTLGLEARFQSWGNLILDGVEVGGSARRSLELMPEASFCFGDSFTLQAGWAVPLWRLTAEAGRNLPVSYQGEFLLRADYIL